MKRTKTNNKKMKRMKGKEGARHENNGGNKKGDRRGENCMENCSNVFSTLQVAVFQRVFFIARVNRQELAGMI